MFDILRARPDHWLLVQKDGGRARRMHGSDDGLPKRQMVLFAEQFNQLLSQPDAAPPVVGAPHLRFEPCYFVRIEAAERMPFAGG